jgi:hypothetical protein
MDQMTSESQSTLASSKSSRSLVIAIGVGLLAFGIYLWQLTVPEFIAFYDSGVYLAASMHFVSGVLPYRDFTFVNPPGILLLMSPVALFARIFGSHDGFILARIVTSFVTALNVSLLTLLVRHRGRIAMVIAGAGLALLPVALFVSSDLKLDPYCICFVLLGSLVVVSRDQEQGKLSKRSFMIGGFLFGLAALVKLWAFFPFLALVICLVPRYRSRVLLFVGAAGGGFIVPSLPFFVLASRNFISQVFTDQLVQKVNPAISPGVIWRLIDLTGFSQTSIAPTGKEAVAAFVMLLFIVAIAFRRRLVHETVDIYLLLASAITVSGVLAAPAYQTYYGYFAAPFLVGVFAISVGRLEEPVRRQVDRINISRAIRRLSSWSSAVAGIVLIFALTLYVTTFYRNFAWFWGIYGPNISAVNKVIPAGACVVYDYVIYGVYANRLQSNDPGCPNVVDPYGMWQSRGDHLIAPAPAFVAQWKTYFEVAQYVVLHSPESSYVPWNPSLTEWFANNYHLVYNKDYVYIYGNDSKT